MRKASLIILSAILVSPLSAVASNVTTFQNGTTVEVAQLADPIRATNINLSVPADGTLMGASVDISSVIPNATNPDCPGRVQVYLGDTLLWEFSGSGYGALGRQDVFLPDTAQRKSSFGEDGGSGNCSIRLMKDAVIKNATMEVKCSGAGSVIGMDHFRPLENSNYFGFSVSGAGDVNGDGYDDVIIGEPENSSKGKNSGMAHIFFGGPVINRTADVALAGESPWNFFGVSVSGAGDVNGDGCDDVIVGATNLADRQPPNDVSTAYVYFGGAAMDALPDVVLKGWSNSSFGVSVSGAGDVNGDGFDDVVVGAANLTTENGVGRALVYFGGPRMDNASDVMLVAGSPGEGFGHAVSGAGDINNDSYDDVIVGAYTGVMRPDANPAGHGAYLFLGGKTMDGGADLYFDGEAQDGTLGVSVSGAGDVDGDGYDDMAVGSPGRDSNRGAAFVYYGGERPDGEADIVFNGTSAGDLFGASVSDAGDVNADGLADLVITAPGFSKPDWIYLGKAYVLYGGEDMQWNRDPFFIGTGTLDGYYLAGSSAGDVNGDGFDEFFLGSPVNDLCPIFTHGGDGLYQPDISVGGRGVWTKTGHFRGAETTLPFPMILQNYLDSKPPGVKDSYGNVYVDVPVSLTAKCGGTITLGRLNVTYVYQTTILNFTQPLSEYVKAHLAEQDAAGNVTVPIKVVSATPGRMKLLNPLIKLDGPPVLRAPIPDQRLAEDTRADALLDLQYYFRDDYDAFGDLRFCATAVTNGSAVGVTIHNGHFLSADSRAQPMSRNWTGEARVVVGCTDTRNRTARSNEFTITVYNVNDVPLIIGPEPPPAFTGEEYRYQVLSADGDEDPVEYALVKGPTGMAIDPTTGLISWPSPVKGVYEMIVRVSDGQENSSRSYILTVSNRPIWIANWTVPEAQKEVRYSYKIPAVSETGKELVYRLAASPAGMTVGAYSGVLEWIPAHAGEYPVSVNVSDGDYHFLYNFTINVVRGNKAPRFVSDPVLKATQGLKYEYPVRAMDEDGDALSFSFVSSPANMIINASSGMVEWMPAATGDFNVTIKVSDGRGGEGFQEYMLRVREYARAKVEILEPRAGRTVSGRVTIEGRATGGTLGVGHVEVRIDSGDWVQAEGNSTWFFKLDTTRLADGGHRLGVRAFDGYAYSEEATREFNVRNAGIEYPLILGAVIIALVAAAAAILKRRRGRSPGVPGQAVPEGAAPEAPPEASPPENAGRF